MSSAEGKQFAQLHKMSYLETSAEKGDNIEDMFEVVSRDLYHNIKIGNLIPNSEVKTPIVALLNCCIAKLLRFIFFYFII